jgi:hypothetical protein
MLETEKFAGGYDEYRPVVMWFWNDEIDEEEIRRQLDGFYEQRIFHFFIHPQSGLLVEYLSDRFFQLVGVAIEHAKSRGMKFWIYDEYNWPSGMMGGKLLRDYPEYRMRVVRHKRLNVHQGQQAEIACEGRLLNVQAVYGGVIRNITEEGRFDETAGTFNWINSDTSMCELHVFVEVQQGGIFASSMLTPYSWYQEGYLDTMNPEAVRKFLELTHERYEARFKEHFGETLVGVFTDEPNLANPFDFGPGTIPWTNSFEHIFREKNGYDLLPRLLELIEDVGDYRRTRFDYWRTLTERFADSYAAQTAKWCEERGIVLTGHVSGEENLIADLLQTGNAFTFLKHLHVPAIDSIFSKQRIVNEDFNLAGKLVVSVAEHNGAARTLCETYTGSGWDLTLEEMRKIANRLAVLGVNTIQYMGAYYTLRGMRKRLPIMYPTTHNFQIPAWQYYGLFSDYISRLCRANSYGTHAAEIAVLMPTTSVFSEYALRHEFWDCVKPYEERPYGDLDITESTLQGVCNALLQIQRDFDLLHEPSFLEAEIEEDGTLRFRGHAYKQLMIPSALALTADICRKLLDFISQGGHVCFVNLLPYASPDHAGITGDIARVCGISPEQAAEDVRRCWNNRTQRLTAVRHVDRVSWIVSNELKQTDNAGLRDALEECLAWLPALITLKEPFPGIHLLHRRQQETNADLFLIINDGTTAYDGGFRISRIGAVSAFDPASGQAHTPLQRIDENGAIDLHLPVEGGQAWIVEVNPAAEGSGALSSEEWTAPGSLTLDLSGEWAFTPSEQINYLRLDLEVAADGGGHEQRRWLPVRDFMFPAGSGFTLGSMYTARARFTIVEMPEELELVVDPAEELAVRVNGKEIAPVRSGQVWDPKNLLYSIRSLVRIGENVVELRERIPDYGAPHMPALIVLRGPFGVSADRSIQRLPETLHVPGSWTDQQFPDFSGKGIYSRSLQLTKSEADCAAHLIVEDCRDVIELWVNGDRIGTSMWRPHRFDISGAMKAGVNQLELRVSNTMANLMEHPVESGLTGAVKLLFRE